MADLGVLYVVNDNRALETCVRSDGEQRSLQCLVHDSCAGLLITLERLDNLLHCILCVNVSGSATCDDALFHCGTSCVQRILHTKLCFLHLGLGSCTDLDHSDTTSELCESLLELLAVEIRGCGLDLLLDLCDTAVDIGLLALTIDDGGLLLRYLYALCAAELLDGCILELEAEVCGDYLTAGQDRDILKHLLTSVAIARSLDSNDVEGTSQLVNDEGCECLTLDILCDDEKLCAHLYDLLEERKDILDVGDLLIGDQDERIIEICLHLIHIGAHVRADVASVELHTFNDIQLGLHGLGLLDGDDTILGNLLHRIGNHLTNLLVTS